MNYRQTLEYLYEQLPMFHRIGAAAYKADLNNTIALCEILWHPEKGFKSVHVAGTNGKGSTSHIMASVLQSAGYKTGLYTSPHLKDFRERIKINGEKIAKSYVTKFVNQNKEHFSQIQPSFFEYTAVMAFQYFADEKVDIAVIETGMGGRLDSTNVITPLVSVITNISKDHTAYLGDTLVKIAREKAGIIKQGVPVVIGETQPEISLVFREKADTMGSVIYFADQRYQLISENKKISLYSILSRDGVPVKRDGVPVKRDGVPVKRDGVPLRRDSIPLRSPLKGIYQEKNFITSYQTLQILKESGYEITDENIRHGFLNVVKQTGLMGRWQTIAGKPKTICDVGHNEAGIRYILQQLKMEKFEKLHWVLGMVNDKDVDGILKLLPPDAVFYFCKANIPRGLDATELKMKAGDFGLSGAVYPSVKDALQAAKIAAGPKDLVFIGGSTFIVAEVL